jgi:hypothetical protein
MSVLLNSAQKILIAVTMSDVKIAVVSKSLLSRNHLMVVLRLFLKRNVVARLIVKSTRLAKVVVVLRHNVPVILRTTVAASKLMVPKFVLTNVAPSTRVSTANGSSKEPRSMQQQKSATTKTMTVMEKSTTASKPKSVLPSVARALKHVLMVSGAVVLLLQQSQKSVMVKIMIAMVKLTKVANALQERCASVALIQVSAKKASKPVPVVNGVLAWVNKLPSLKFVTVKITIVMEQLMKT